MKKSFFNIILASIFLSKITLSSNHRAARHLLFNEGSRLFVSVDIRDNLFIHSDFFAEAFGFKVIWNLPEKVSNLRGSRINKRDLHRGLQTLLNHYNINGSSCFTKLKRAVDLRGDHFLSQLYKLIFLSPDENFTGASDVAETRSKDNMADCPLSILSSKINSKQKMTF